MSTNTENPAVTVEKTAAYVTAEVSDIAPEQRWDALRRHLRFARATGSDDTVQGVLRVMKDTLTLRHAPINPLATTDMNEREVRYRQEAALLNEYTEHLFWCIWQLPHLVPGTERLMENAQVAFSEAKLWMLRELMERARGGKTQREIFLLCSFFLWERRISRSEPPPEEVAAICPFPPEIAKLYIPSSFQNKVLDVVRKTYAPPVALMLELLALSWLHEELRKHLIIRYATQFLGADGLLRSHRDRGFMELLEPRIPARYLGAPRGWEQRSEGGETLAMKMLEHVRTADVAVQRLIETLQPYDEEHPPHQGEWRMGRLDPRKYDPDAIHEIGEGCEYVPGTITPVYPNDLDPYTVTIVIELPDEVRDLNLARDMRSRAIRHADAWHVEHWHFTLTFDVITGADGAKFEAVRWLRGKDRVETK